MNIFFNHQLLPIIWCLNEPSHCDGSFEYPQHMFWLRNKTIYNLVRNHNLSPDVCHCKCIIPYRFVQNKFRISFYDELFLSILTSFPPWPIMPFLYDVWNVKLQQYAKGLVWSRGGKHFSKTFSIFYMLNSKNRVFNPYFKICTCPMRKTLLRIIRESNLLSFWWKNFRFLWNFFSGHFYGQSFIKTVRGPLALETTFLLSGLCQHL